MSEEFDLDLTYITERIIAMSFPATGMESTYRNSLKDVAKMLKTKHQENYMVCGSIFGQNIFHVSLFLYSNFGYDYHSMEIMCICNFKLMGMSVSEILHACASACAYIVVSFPLVSSYAHM